MKNKKEILNIIGVIAAIALVAAIIIAEVISDIHKAEYAEKHNCRWVASNPGYICK